MTKTVLQSVTREWVYYHLMMLMINYNQLTYKSVTEPATFGIAIMIN